MKYDKVTNILKMQPTSKGDYHLKLVLTDEDDQTTEELLLIQFKYDKVIEKEIEIIKTEIEELDELGELDES